MRRGFEPHTMKPYSLKASGEAQGGQDHSVDRRISARRDHGSLPTLDGIRRIVAIACTWFFIARSCSFQPLRLSGGHPHAIRNDAGVHVAPEHDQQFSGQRDRHDFTDPALGAAGACGKPLTQGTVCLVSQPPPS
jgi:hypothetical protein